MSSSAFPSAGTACGRCLVTAGLRRRCSCGLQPHVPGVRRPLAGPVVGPPGRSLAALRVTVQQHGYGRGRVSRAAVVFGYYCPQRQQVVDVRCASGAQGKVRGCHPARVGCDRIWRDLASSPGWRSPDRHQADAWCREVGSAAKMSRAAAWSVSRMSSAPESSSHGSANAIRRRDGGGPVISCGAAGVRLAGRRGSRL